jgi:hypothetical protein
MCLIIFSGFSAQAEKAENIGFGRVRWNFWSASRDVGALSSAPSRGCHLCY